VDSYRVQLGIATLLITSTGSCCWSLHQDSLHRLTGHVLPLIPIIHQTTTNAALNRYQTRTATRPHYSSQPC